eukprot:TRINITY_DN98718_c0_g1_i1.p1 TRINITY_DN98718_c0_g1~~TRINITY_DN98718_c0_g1_i1.p1  ORF type:complete len:150 (+),score=44.40 TRINITY_DN98718_c0_g1_i1:68-451(+)
MAEELEKAVLEVVAAAKDSGMEWMVSFGEFDGDGDQSLSLEEFKEGLEKLGLDADLIESGAGELFNSRDWSKDGRISKREFTEFIAGKAAQLEEAPLAAGEATFTKKDAPDGDVGAAVEADTKVEDM